MQVVFSPAQYLDQKRISEGGRRPIMRYIVWLLVPLQGQKEAVTERGLEFLIINSPTTWRRILSTSRRQNVEYNLTLCEMTMISSPIFYVYISKRMHEISIQNY